MAGWTIAAESLRLPAEPASCALARRFVSEHAREWHHDALIDAAALCATELATNALLHSRDAFVLTVREAGSGLRIDVLDNCPHQLPIATPIHGTAVDLTSCATAGRGIQIVASLAERWGISTTEDYKSVWVEPCVEPQAQPAEPILWLHSGSVPKAQAVHLDFFDLPVRAAVASGIQTEEVIREIQLDQASSKGLSDDEVSEFFNLIDRTASIRLPGRYAALRAAADGRIRFDFTLDCSVDALHGLAALAPALARYGSSRDVPLPVVTEEIAAFRTWLNDEGARQRGGTNPAMSCPLP